MKDTKEISKVDEGNRGIGKWSERLVIFIAQPGRFQFDDDCDNH